MESRIGTELFLVLFLEDVEHSNLLLSEIEDEQASTLFFHRVRADRGEKWPLPNTREDFQ